MGDPHDLAPRRPLDPAAGLLMFPDNGALGLECLLPFGGGGGDGVKGFEQFKI